MGKYSTVREFPTILVSYCSQVGNGYAHEQCLSDSPFLGKGKMMTPHTACSEQAQFVKFNVVHSQTVSKG